ncbi:MAG: hypothetical protein KIS92_07685 [Planctomycetota bacterium]|nr:hypothetical protein [Planctomycetota bacterium]
MHSVAAGAQGKDKPKPPAELIATVKMTTLSTQDRTEAVKTLSALSSAQEVRDHKVVESLLDVAQNKKDDIFVRMAAIEALGTLQFNLFQTDDFAKNRYLEPLSTMLKGKDEDELIRQSVALTFQRTLKNTGLKDREVFETLSKIAEDKAEPLLVRIACVDFVGAFGHEKGITVLATILSQIDLDKAVREAVVRSFAQLLASVDNLKEVNFAVVNKVKEMVVGKDFPNEIRADGLRVLARLKANKIKGVDDSVIEVIKKVLKTETDANLVVASVDALGIIGDDGALDDLTKAYTDFFDKSKVDRAADVRIRVAIMKVLGNLLSAQNQAQAPNSAALKKCVDLLVKPLDLVTKPTEADEVTAAAIFSLRYLYPKKKEFQNFHKEVIDKLILILKPTANNTNRNFDEGVTETLKAITRQPYGKDPAQWDRWYDETYGIKVKQ